MIKIEKAKVEEAYEIAKLHKKEIPTGFFSKQNIDILKELYLYIIKNELVFVAKKKGEIVGYVAFTSNTKMMHKNFIKKNRVFLMKILLNKIFSFNFLKNVLKTLFLPQKMKIENIDCELLSIVVNSHYQNMGIGKKLIDFLEEELKKRCIKEYKLYVGESLKANSFYIRNSFVFIKKIKINQNRYSNLYIKKIDT